MRKTCGADTRAAGEITAGHHCGWNNGTRQNPLELCQSKYEFGCKSSLICQRLPRASLLRKCRRSCARTWYNALLSGVTILLDTMSSLPNDVAVCTITVYCFHGVTASGHFSKRHTHISLSMPFHNVTSCSMKKFPCFPLTSSSNT